MAKPMPALRAEGGGDKNEIGEERGDVARDRLRRYLHQRRDEGAVLDPATVAQPM